MRIKLTSTFVAIFLLSFIITSCDNDSNTEIIEQATPDETPIENEEEIEVEIANGISYYDSTKVSSGLILINDAADNSVYLMNKNGQTVYEWPLHDERLGNDAFLLPSGKILAMLETPNPDIGFGGVGGKVSILDKEGNAEWSFTYATENHILHHDAVMLPNGNILTMIWERKTSLESKDAGYELEVDTFPDGLIEIDPTTDTIVWEWYVWDHIIQDYDETKSNYGIVSENPHKIDVNYVVDQSGDITHGNGISYDTAKDVIYFSANFYSEIWVIDHSTTSEEAKSSTGGNFSKGGDLLYRFGNPSAYKSEFGKRLFNNNHFPNLLQSQNRMMVFSNGAELERSTVYEIQLPEEFALTIGEDNEPEVVWTFTNAKLFAPKVSGAVKLPNGNVLITEGDFGFWEVTQEKEIVWQYERNGFYWRGYSFDENDEAIINLELDL